MASPPPMPRNPAVTWAFALFVGRARDHHHAERNEIDDVGPLQDHARRHRGRPRPEEAANQEGRPERHEPRQRRAVAPLPIAPDAREAGWGRLRDQRHALRKVLLGSEQQHREHDETASRAHAQKTGCHAADQSDGDAGKEPVQEHRANPFATRAAAREPIAQSWPLRGLVAAYSAALLLSPPANAPAKSGPALASP